MNLKNYTSIEAGVQKTGVTYDCPFCGGEGQLLCDENDKYCISCEDCDVESPAFETPNQAGVFWNRRQDL